MNVKVSICCLCYVFCALISQTHTEFRHEDIDWTRVKEYAVWTSSLLAGNKNLIQNAPKTYNFIRALATDAKSFVATVNPAYAAATVYFTAVVAVTYYYSVEAQQLLQKAQFKNDDLKLIIDTEIIPILNLLERLHSKGDMDNFCRAKNELGNLFGYALTSLQGVRKDLQQQMLDSTSGAEKNKVLQWLSVGIGVAGVTVIATAPCLATGLLACPQAIAGSTSLLPSIFGVLGFGYNKMTHEQTMELLNATSLVAFEAEKVFRRARTDTEIICVEYPSLPEKLLRSLEVYMLRKPTMDRLQLEDGELKKDRPSHD